MPIILPYLPDPFLDALNVTVEALEERLAKNPPHPLATEIYGASANSPFFFSLNMPRLSFEMHANQDAKDQFLAALRAQYEQLYSLATDIAKCSKQTELFSLQCSLLRLAYGAHEKKHLILQELVMTAQYSYLHKISSESDLLSAIANLLIFVKEVQAWQQSGFSLVHPLLSSFEGNTPQEKFKTITNFLTTFTLLNQKMVELYQAPDKLEARATHLALFQVGTALMTLVLRQTPQLIATLSAPPTQPVAISAAAALSASIAESQRIKAHHEFQRRILSAIEQLTNPYITKLASVGLAELQQVLSGSCELLQSITAQIHSEVTLFSDKIDLTLLILEVMKLLKLVFASHSPCTDDRINKENLLAWVDKICAGFLQEIMRYCETLKHSDIREELFQKYTCSIYQIYFQAQSWLDNLIPLLDRIEITQFANITHLSEKLCIMQNASAGNVSASPVYFAQNLRQLLTVNAGDFPHVATADAARGAFCLK